MTSSTGDDMNRRLLVIDDNQAIHADFRKVLGGNSAADAALDQMEAALFGQSDAPQTVDEAYSVDSALQGQEGLDLVRRSLNEGNPYALAFVDMRMPPGWDGIETIVRIWEEDPHLQIVVCTAYSDHSWDEMRVKLQRDDQWLILKKPFDNVEVRQMATALTTKWNLSRRLAQRMDNLEQAVRERTCELESQKSELEQALSQLEEAHAQLLQADKMASIGQLAAGVAHEINNPIGFISSNLNSLQAYINDIKQVLAADDELLAALAGGVTDLDARARQAEQARQTANLQFVVDDLADLISESVEGTQRVRRIVADLRDFSHIDAPDVNEEDVNNLIDKTINVAWNELKYKSEVVREYGRVPPLPCYGGKLGQVFLNLLVNAAHAIEKQGTITVRTGAADERVWIEIQDTGCGIPPENLKRVFDPFFTTKEVGKGTGMGLNLAYKIVEAHGGRISVDSTVGEGTTFRIELPLSGPSEVTESSSATGTEKH